MNGNADEKKIMRFLAIGSGSGYGSGDGSGSGSGYGSGDGSGYGSGDGSGSGSGYGSGDGDGSGYGSGDGSGYGSGSGDGSGDGDGSGYGSGDGSGDGVKSVCGKRVYSIDNVPTLISSVHNMYAKGHILNSDLSLTPTYVARIGDSFAHGATLREARRDAEAKDMESRPVEERIAAFVKAHPFLDALIDGRDLYDWHHILTGSCRAGRDAWCRDNGLNPATAKMSVEEFCRRACNAYGGEVIRLLADRYGIQLEARHG